MEYRIDVKRITDGNIIVLGWVLPKNLHSDVNFFVTNENGDNVDIKVVRVKRDDVASLYLKDYYGNKDFGFSCEIPYTNNNLTYTLHILTENEEIKIKLNKKLIDDFNTKSRKKRELLLDYLNKNTFKRAFKFFLESGPKEFIKKTKRKLSGLDVDYDYSEWYELTKPTAIDIVKQKNEDNFKIKPLYSIVIPVYDTDTKFLKLLFDSISNQTYKNYEICVADATDYKTCKNNPKSFFEKLNNDKLKVKYLDKNLSIADNTNEAIDMASGDYIVLCDHDDELTCDALYEVTKCINEKSDSLIIYSDEDKVDMTSGSYFEPAFKSDFNLDMLLSVNYFCHLTTIKKDLLTKLKSIDGSYERSDYNGAQDYDLFLRLVNIIINDTYKNGRYDTSKIVHIPKVLYHWRCHKKSTSKNVSSKSYAFSNGIKAIENFYKNTKINFSNIDRVENGFDYGLYHTVYKKTDEPLISIIIPNKDHIKDLDLTINSVLSGNYKNIEFIICENNSTEKETFDYYDNLSQNEHIKVIKYQGTFNYSKINNFSAKYINGDYILFLNNDVEMIARDSLHEMLSYIKRDDVGAVGAKLLYKDNTYQHAGLVIGIGGIADHLFRGISDFDHTYMNRAQIVQDLNACTAACLMVKKTVFQKFNGFNEELAVAFNDVDLCLRIRKAGYLIVYNPYSSFYHYESKSRGLEDTPEKVKRFNTEWARFANIWSDRLEKIDEYYNPNLTLRKNNFALRDLKNEKIGEPFPTPVEIKDIMKTI